MTLDLLPRYRRRPAPSRDVPLRAAVVFTATGKWTEPEMATLLSATERALQLTQAASDVLKALANGDLRASGDTIRYERPGPRRKIKIRERHPIPADFWKPIVPGRVGDMDHWANTATGVDQWFANVTLERKSLEAWAKLQNEATAPQGAEAPASAEAEPPQSESVPQSRFSPAELEREYRNYIQRQLAAGNRSSEKEDFEAMRNILGSAVPRDAFRLLRRQLPRDHWKREGRPRASGSSRISRK